MSEPSSFLPGTEADFHGLPTRHIENGHCWLEVLAQAGPRIVRFGLKGGESILAETPKAGWDAGYGRFELYGGHRVWFAPEAPECSIPESSGLAIEPLPEANGIGFALVGPLQRQIGLRKRMEIRLAADAAAIEIRHVLSLEGEAARQLSVWPITQLKLGGVARVELPKAVATDRVAPNRPVVLWEYASWDDSRLSLHDGLLTVEARPAPKFKIGCLSHAGRVVYERQGLQFVKSFEPEALAARPDFGCNLEIYSDEGSIELESLGPLTTLQPGTSASHLERWELRTVE